jgi:hypothetical protein
MIGFINVVFAILLKFQDNGSTKVLLCKSFFKFFNGAFS